MWEIIFVALYSVSFVLSSVLTPLPHCAGYGLVHVVVSVFSESSSKDDVGFLVSEYLVFGIETVVSLVVYGVVWLGSRGIWL